MDASLLKSDLTEVATTPAWIFETCRQNQTACPEMVTASASRTVLSDILFTPEYTCPGGDTELIDGHAKCAMELSASICCFHELYTVNPTAVSLRCVHQRF